MQDVHRTESLSRHEADAVTALAAAAHEKDKVAPLSEQTLLRVRHGSPSVAIRFLLLRAAGEEGRLAGFAFAELPTGEDGAAAEPASAELVVAPEFRGQGYGSRLLEALIAEAPADGLRVWAHGDLPEARALARRHGLSRARGLLKMRFALEGELSDPIAVLAPETAGRLRFRTFVAGQDEEAWLRVNTRAFVDHPEQRAVTLDDLLQREAEDWFDPEGFFVAEVLPTGRFAGFHWTKVHADGAGLRDDGAVGEVYVVGVDPEWQGTGLGRALTLAGLHHLRDRGLPLALLYVDEDNRAAVRLYESLGFTRWDTDVMYAAGPIPQ